MRIEKEKHAKAKKEKNIKTERVERMIKWHQYGCPAIYCGCGMVGAWWLRRKKRNEK